MKPSGPPIELAALLSLSWFLWGMLSEYSRTLRRESRSGFDNWKGIAFEVLSWLSVALVAVPPVLAISLASLRELVEIIIGTLLVSFAAYVPVAFVFFGLDGSRYSRYTPPLLPSSARTKAYVAALLLPVTAMWMYSAVARRYGIFSAA